MENGQNFNWEDGISGFELVAQNADFMVHDAYTPEDQKEQYAYQRDAANITAGALADLQNSGIGTYTANGTTIEISRDSETGSFTVTQQDADGTSAGSVEVFSPDQADAAFDRFYNDVYDIVSGRAEGVDGGIENRISGFETMAHSADFMEHDRYTPDNQRAGYEYQRETCSVMIDALHDVQATGHGEFALNGVSVEIDRNRETGEWRVTETATDGTITGNAFHPENGNEAIDSFYERVYDVISNDGEKIDTGTEVPDHDSADNGIESTEGDTGNDNPPDDINVNTDIDNDKRPPASGGAADSVPADGFADTQENQDLQTGNDISAEKDIDTDAATHEDTVNTEANPLDENEESVNDDRIHEDTDDRQTEFIRTEDSDNSFTVGPDHDTTEENLTEEKSAADTERVKDENPDKAAFHDVELTRDEDGNTTVSIDGYEMFTDPDPYAVNADDLSALLEDNSDAIRVEISRGDSFASYDDFKDATENRSEWLAYLDNHADAANYIDSHIDEYDKPPEEWTQQDLMQAINDVESSGVLDDVDNERDNEAVNEVTDGPRHELSAAGIDTDGLSEDQINVLETGLQQGLSSDQLHEIAVSGLDADGMMELEADIWEDNSINYEQSQIENDLYDTPDDVSSEDRQWVHDHLVDNVMNSIDPEAFQYGGLTDRELRMLDDAGIELPDTYDYDMPVGGYDDEDDDETISIYDYKQEFAERIDEAMQELKESWDDDPDAFLSQGTMSISQDTYNLIEDIYYKGYELQDESREAINSDIKDSLESIESALVDYEMAEGHDFNIINDKPDASEEEKAAAMEDLEETRDDTVQTIQNAFDSYFQTGNDVDKGTENTEKDSDIPNTAETDSEDDVYIIDDYGFPIEDDDLSQKDVDEKTDQINNRIEGLMRDLSGAYRVHPDDFAERAQAIIEGNDIEDEIEDLEGEAYYDGYDMDKIAEGIHDEDYQKIADAVRSVNAENTDEEKEAAYEKIQEAFDSYFGKEEDKTDRETETEKEDGNKEEKGSEADLIGRLQSLSKDLVGSVTSVIQDIMGDFISGLKQDDGQDKASNDDGDEQKDVEKENKAEDDTSWDGGSEWSD